ncbi:peptidyl-tRNA hydrolase, partial [Didymella exigua CBS 183.55]
MSNAPTRAHVASPTALALAAAPAAADPQNIPATQYLSNDAINRRSGLNKREARKQRKAQQPLPTPPDTSSETDASPNLSNKPPQARKVRPASAEPSTDTTASIPQPLPSPIMPPGNPIPLLVCSIGNPGPAYANTLHSAGHIVTSYIAGRKSYQPFTKGLSGLVARPDNTTFSLSLLKGYSKTQGGPPEDDWTFWQSLSLMNVSGVGVKKAYAAWLAELRRRTDPQQEGRLVVVHDELESALGKVAVRESGASARGHNGLKSCQAQLQGVKWWRVGVG